MKKNEVKPQGPFADSLGFLAPPDMPPIFDPGESPELSVIHVTSVAPFVTDFNAALENHKKFREQALSNPGTYEVLSKKDLGKPGLGILFGMQHTPPGITKKKVRELSDAGIRVMSLAYRTSTEYGGGFASRIGLTDRGRELLQWMGECDIIPDISHSNNQTACDTFMFAVGEEIPLVPMASHSACSYMYPHRRNASGEVLLWLRELKGYVGIPTVTFMLGPKEAGCHMAAFAAQIRFVTKIMGMENIGIGSDGIHKNMSMDEARANYLRMQKMLKGKNDPFGAYFPDRIPAAIEEGQKMFGVLATGLTLHNPHFTEEDIRRICGGNFLSYLSRSLPA